MRVRLGAAGHQHSPVGIGVEVTACEDTAGAPRARRNARSRWEQGELPLCPTTRRVSRDLYQDLGLGAWRRLSHRTAGEPDSDGGPASEEGHSSRRPRTPVSPGCCRWRVPGAGLLSQPWAGGRATVPAGHGP